MYSFPIRFILQPINFYIVPQRLNDTSTAVLLDTEHASKVRMDLELLWVMFYVQEDTNFGGLVAHASDCESVKRCMCCAAVPL